MDRLLTILELPVQRSKNLQEVCENLTALTLERAVSTFRMG